MKSFDSAIATTETILRDSKDFQILYVPPVIEPSAGEFASFDQSSLHPAILEPLVQRFPSGLFTHQHKAIERVLAGQHTVTATRTSSGKSLTFALPALHSLCDDANATALFLYPQKALANDQLQSLKDLAGSIGPAASLLKRNPDFISRYDGGVPGDDRGSIRKSVQMLITNPDMLHIGILQHHQTNWSRFFANLKLVAIDECHDYRGAFGAHVAMVLRRLRLACRIHGSSPVFTASSATIADPQQHLHRLTGLDFGLIGPDMDRSLQGRRKIWMVGGQAHHHDLGQKLAVQLVKQGLRVLVFCPSRVGAEKMLEGMRVSDGIPTDQMEVYRAGLSSEQRSKIERGLKAGTTRLVFSTSALELGIDIGQLDAVICVGLPSTMMSFWQRAGRVARGGREGAIILIPGNSPVETYYAQRPQEFFTKDHEPIAVNIDNDKIVCQHYACAIDENGSDESSVDASLLGPTAERVQGQRARGEYCGADDFVCNNPHGSVNLRSNGDESFKLVASGKTIGEIGMSHLLREASRNAIYRHGGAKYRVQAIVRGEGIVRLVKENSPNDTVAFVRKGLTLRKRLKGTDHPGLQMAVGVLEISEYLETLTEKEPSGKIRRTWTRPGGHPMYRLKTEGVLIIPKAPICQELRQSAATIKVAAESAERLLAGLFPTIAGPCDSQDYSSGIMTTGEGDTAIVLYDSAYGGIGLTEAAYRRTSELVDHALDRVHSCQCETDAGCIRCVAHPRQESDASKSAAITLLQSIKASLDAGSGTSWVADDDSSGPTYPVASAECPSCQSAITKPGNFCQNCGHKLEISHA